MRFDFYAELAATSQSRGIPKLPAELASGFVDECAVRASVGGGENKNQARQCYLEQLRDRELVLPAELGLEGRGDPPLPKGWVSLEVEFTLQAPWYSKDDRAFHVLDNPVRKDPVFGVPFMSAANWKGLLRHACRMQSGLFQHLQAGRGFDAWCDPPWLAHLFGNQKDEEHTFRRGALAFRPTWFSKIDFEVINPHSRAKRAGKLPIFYEVVPRDAKGRLRLLYSPLAGAAERDGVVAADALERLSEAVERLLPGDGISAKRNAGWGIARITKWPLGCATRAAFVAAMRASLSLQDGKNV